MLGIAAMNGYSTTDVMEFLEYMATKGLAKKSTMSSRRVSCSKVFAILDDEQREDVREIDLEEIMARFANISGSNYTPDTLTVYKSRVAKSIEEFLRYKQNPAGFKLSSTVRTRKRLRPEGREEEASEPASGGEDSPQEGGGGNSEIQTIDFPVALRPGCIVRVCGIPTDLTKNEASKIANVVSAMVAIETE